MNKIVSHCYNRICFCLQINIHFWTSRKSYVTTKFIHYIYTRTHRESFTFHRINITWFFNSSSAMVSLVLSRPLTIKQDSTSNLLTVRACVKCVFIPYINLLFSFIQKYYEHPFFWKFIVKKSIDFSNVYCHPHARKA